MSNVSFHRSNRSPVLNLIPAIQSEWLKVLRSVRHRLHLWRSMLVMGVALSGCAHAQLNSNTIDLVQSLDSLYRKQALINLSRLIDDPNTLPSQVDITSGQVQTQTQASGTGNFPIGSQVLETLPSGAGAGTALSVSQITEQVRSLMFCLNNTQQQGWNINPVTDSNAPYAASGHLPLCNYGGLSENAPIDAVGGRHGEGVFERSADLRHPRG